MNRISQFVPLALLLVCAMSVTYPAMASTKLVDSTTGMEFVPVPAGCFKMGDTTGTGEDDEKPAHEVCLDAYAIGKYEVTQGQWNKVMGSNPSNFKACGDSCPVDTISWNDAQAFVARLNKSSNSNYRLPTEAEWEYAARSGGKQELYSGSADPNVAAWIESNAGQTTHPVGKKQPNGLGIFDMSGNVFEWTADWYAEDFYAKSPAKSPVGPAVGKFRVNRGGSWYVEATGSRTTARGSNEPDKKSSNLGLRLVAPVK